jgi:F-type H+-transporting ATPase subunit epsilon
MAEKKLICEVITPEKIVFRGEVDMVIAPAIEGEVGILPLHAPFFTQLAIGELRVKFSVDGKEKEEYIAVHGGFMEVFEDKVTVMAPAAELAREIDIERAKRAAEKAEALLGEEMKGIEHIRADVALRRARVRIKIAGRI